MLYNLKNASKFELLDVMYDIGEEHMFRTWASLSKNTSAREVWLECRVPEWLSWFTWAVGGAPLVIEAARQAVSRTEGMECHSILLGQLEEAIQEHESSKEDSSSYSMVEDILSAVTFELSTDKEGYHSHDAYCSERSEQSSYFHGIWDKMENS